MSAEGKQDRKLTPLEKRWGRVASPLELIEEAHVVLDRAGVAPGGIVDRVASLAVKTQSVKEWPYSRARGFWWVTFEGRTAVAEVDERYPVGVAFCPVGPSAYITGEEHPRHLSDPTIEWGQFIGSGPSKGTS